VRRNKKIQNFSKRLSAGASRSLFANLVKALLIEKIIAVKSMSSTRTQAVPKP
jgi:hypothetical protein